MSPLKYRSSFLQQTTGAFRGPSQAVRASRCPRPVERFASFQPRQAADCRASPPAPICSQVLRTKNSGLSRD